MFSDRPPIEVTSGTRNLNPGVTSQENYNPRDKSEEGKAARAALKGLNVLSFDAFRFAWPIALSPVAVRRRFLSVVVALTSVWVLKFDNGTWESDEELEFLVEVKRVHEALAPFYPNN